MEALEHLKEGLQQAKGDWGAIQEAFSSHFASSFLHDFISTELGALDQDYGHVVRHSVGQANFTFINTDEFEYSVRILAPFPPHQHKVKWFGMRQMIGIKGKGTAIIRKLTVPADQHIRQFQQGVAIEEIEPIRCTQGTVVASDSVHQMLDVHHVLTPVVAEVLTHREGDEGLFWTFDHTLKSRYAEQSSATMSRFRSVLELAHASGRKVPDEIYDLALSPSRPHVAMMAIRSMLLMGHPDAFDRLLHAMESESEALRTDAIRLFDSMTNTQGDIHAA
jgi:hypothetical protein